MPSADFWFSVWPSEPWVAWFPCNIQCRPCAAGTCVTTVCPLSLGADGASSRRRHPRHRTCLIRRSESWTTWSSCQWCCCSGCTAGYFWAGCWTPTICQWRCGGAVKFSAKQILQIKSWVLCVWVRVVVVGWDCYDWPGVWLCWQWWHLRGQVYIEEVLSWMVWTWTAGKTRGRGVGWDGSVTYVDGWQ